MKKMLVISIIALVFSSVYIKAGPSYDAITLTLRQQQTIRLDYRLCNMIDSMLTSAVQLDSNFKKIHALPNYIFNSLIVKTLNDCPWSDSLLKNGLVSGDPYIDSLNNAFHLVKVEDRYDYIVLKYNDTLRIDLLSKLYKKDKYVFYAQPNYLYHFDNPDNIYFISECGGNNFVFARMEPFGPFYYIQIDLIDNKYYSKIIKIDTLKSPEIFLWNVPDRYNCSIFKSVDEIKDSITKSLNWWVRRHAIESSKALLKNERPTNGEDNDKIFKELKKEIEPRWREFITLYQDYSKSDDCSYVRESALNAFEQNKLPLGTRCLSSEIIDSAGVANIKLSWTAQFRDIINYDLRILKRTGNVFDTFYRDSSITDTSFIFKNVSDGQYKWHVMAKNEFGWVPSFLDYEFCSFEVSTTDLHNDENKSNLLTISPNPVSDILIINSNIPFKKLAIYSVLGLKVMEAEYIEKIDVSHLPAGVYFLVIDELAKLKMFEVIR